MSIRKTMNSAAYANAAAEEMINSRSFWADARTDPFLQKQNGSGFVGHADPTGAICEFWSVFRSVEL